MLLRATPRTVFAMLLALLSAPAAAGDEDETAEHAYQQARRVFYSFKADEQKQKFRHHWHNTAAAFERVAEEYPKSERAADALFTAGRLYYDLYGISRVGEDLERSVELMQQLVAAHPGSHLADDAQLYVALSWIDYRKQPERAVRALATLVERFPDGDVTPKARRMLEDLGGPEAIDVAEPEPAPADEPDAAAAEAKAAAGRPLLARVSHESGPDYTRVTLLTRSPAEYKFGVLPASEKNATPRLYVDLHHARIDPELDSPIAVRDSVVRRIRFAPFSPEVIRVVLDLETLGDYKVFPMEHPARVVIDVSAGSDEVASIIGQAEKKDAGRDAEQKAVGAGAAGGQAEPVAEPHLPDKHKSKPGRSLSMLAGLKVHRVVIDPGHGGRDPGAIGPSKTLEKEVVLDLAKRLAARLEKDESLGLKEVVLTRDRDVFLPLEKRTAIANSRKADLFISIHCNAHRNRRFHGVETFYLDLTDDRYSIKLAARENATSEKSISDLQYILADLALKSHVDDSISLGRSIQKAMVGTLRRRYKVVRDMGIKPALFYVLIGARMPSVLVETSFISNPREERRLRTKAYRSKLVAGIHAGIRNFIRARERMLDPDS